MLLALALPAQTLPWGEAESLAVKKAALPGVWAGRPAVVVWSFSREAGEGVKQWMGELEKEGLEAWSVAVLEAAPRFIRPMIRSGMRKQAAGRVDRWLCLYKGGKGVACRARGGGRQASGGRCGQWAGGHRLEAGRAVRRRRGRGRAPADAGAEVERPGEVR